MSDRLSWGAFIGADHTVQKIPQNIPGYGNVNILSLFTIIYLYISLFILIYSFSFSTSSRKYLLISLILYRKTTTNNNFLLLTKLEKHESTGLG